MSLPLTPVLLSALTGRKGNSRIFHFSLHFNGGIFLGYLMHELTETETIPGYLPPHTRARARGEKRRHFLTHTHWRRAAALLLLSGRGREEDSGLLTPHACPLHGHRGRRQPLDTTAPQRLSLTLRAGLPGLARHPTPSHVPSHTQTCPHT